MIRSCQKRPGAHQPRRWEQNGGYNGNVANRLVCLGGCDPVLVPAHQAWPGVFTYAEPTNRTSGSRLHKDLNSIVERVGNAPVKPPDHRLTLRHYQGGEWQQHSRIFKHTNCTIGAPTLLDTPGSRVVFCNEGEVDRFSTTVEQTLLTAGIDGVYILDGGIGSWHAHRSHHGTSIRTGPPSVGF
jgi:hypothetical protein